SEADVRRALDAIVDPCSAAAGAPAGLDEMGLVQQVDVRPTSTGAHVSVVIRLTAPTCLMGIPFLTSARQRLSELPGVSEVDVSLASGMHWTEADLPARYRERLDRVRAQRRRSGTAKRASIDGAQ
ncbi:MAG TPA: iron-sulfur cluster assembly protein, partial [Solirubrobacteraceae bacterium]